MSKNKHQQNKKSAVKTEASKPLIPGSNIKSAPVVHTAQPTGEIYIPKPEETEELPEGTEGRFIKTAGTPHVATPGVPEEKETEAVTAQRYTDRFTSRAPGKKAHTGYTGKINTYAATHSALSPNGSFVGDEGEIMPAAPIQQSVTEAMPPKKAEKTFEFSGTAAEFLGMEEAFSVSPDKKRSEAVASGKKSVEGKAEQNTAPKKQTEQKAEQNTAPKKQTQEKANQKPEKPEAKPTQPNTKKVPGKKAMPEPESLDAPSFSGVNDGTQVFTAPEKGNANGQASQKTPPKSRDSATRAVDGKGNLLRRIAKSADVGVRKNPDRMMVDGESESIPEETDSRLDSELIKNRAKRFSSFRFWNKQKDTQEVPDEKFTVEEKPRKEIPGIFGRLEERFAGLEAPFNPVQDSEYADAKQRKEVYDALTASRKQAFLRMLILSGLSVVLLLIDGIASVSAKNNPNGFFTVLGGNTYVFMAINAVMLIAGMVLMLKELKNGVISLLKMHPKADSSLVFGFTATLLQTVAAFFTQGKLAYEYTLAAPVMLLLCVPYLLAEVFYYDSLRYGFKSASTKDDVSYLRRVSDEKLVSELLRLKDAGEHTVVYAGKTRYVRDYLKKGSVAAFYGMPASRTVFISLGGSILFLLIAWLFSNSMLSGITAGAFSLIFSFPIAGLLSSGKALSRENFSLSLKSAYILSQKEARELSQVDHIVLSANRIFTVDIPTCYTDKKVNRRQAEFGAAVIASAFTGPLAQAFVKKAAEFSDNFPACEEPVYEERLGFSAWAGGCKVLLGTHRLLENHNVEVPSENSVIQFLQDDEIPVYMALEGRFAAVFGVKYSCRDSVADDLRSLVKRGTNILLDSDDALLSDEFAEKLLKMPAGSVRSVSPAAIEKLNTTRNAVSEAEEAGIGFADSIESMSRCLAAAVRLNSASNLTVKICEFSSYLGLILALALILTKTISGINLLLPVFMQLILCGVCLYLPNIFRKKTVVQTNNKTQATPEKSDSQPKTASDSEKTQPKEKLQKPDEPAPKVQKRAVDDYVSQSFEPPKSEDDGYYTTATDEMLDRFAEDAIEAEQSASRQAPPAQVTKSAKNAQNPAQKTSPKTAQKPVKRRTDDEDSVFDDEDDDDGTSVFSDVVQGIGKYIGNVTGRAKGKQNQGTVAKKAPQKKPENDNARKKAEQPPKAEYKTERKPKEERFDDTDTQRLIEERTRRTFTPPPMPEPPIYDLSKKPDAPDPLKERFVPPTGVDNAVYYTDADFRRFEDDRVFSALQEERKKQS